MRPKFHLQLYPRQCQSIATFVRMEQNFIYTMINGSSTNCTPVKVPTFIDRGENSRRGPVTPSTTGEVTLCNVTSPQGAPVWTPYIG